LIRDFNGKPTGLHVDVFLNQVFEVGELNSWSDDKKIRIARLKMVHPAQLFRDHDDDFSLITRWGAFCDAMRVRFTTRLRPAVPTAVHITHSARQVLPIEGHIRK
jgi:hypothetical protein